MEWFPAGVVFGLLIAGVVVFVLWVKFLLNVWNR